MLGGDREELKNCYYKLYDYFREEAHTPKDMKENLIRYNLFLVNTYKTIRELDAEIQIQEICKGFQGHQLETDPPGNGEIFPTPGL